ncbi:hypothetical protein GCM10009647_044870 [Streptomyces sanglieri]
MARGGLGAGLRLGRARGSAVGERTHDSAGRRTAVGRRAVGHDRAAVQRATRRGLGLGGRSGGRGGRRDAYARQVDRTGVAATGLVGSLAGPGQLLRHRLLSGVRLRGLGPDGLLHLDLDGALGLRGGLAGRLGIGLCHGLGLIGALSGQRGLGGDALGVLARGRYGLRVAPSSLRARHQEEVFVLGDMLGGSEVGVGVRGGDARLLHRACVLRQSLDRDLAGVTHAYPSPIVSAPSALRPGRPNTARRRSSTRTSGLAARHESVADILHSRGRSPPRQLISPRPAVDCATSRVPRFCRTTAGAKTVLFSGH